MTTQYFISDIHGQRARLVELLIEHGVIDAAAHNWIAGDAHLWFLGDFFDRGPDGVGALEMAMKLQAQAADAGGNVGALLGNHELLFLAAHRFKRGEFFAAWRRNGGQESDMARITPTHIEWLSKLPALTLLDDLLLIHADTLNYRDYGNTRDEVNAALRAILYASHQDDWAGLLDDFSERLAFLNARKDTTAIVRDFLRRFGGARLMHGHTPIQYVADVIIPTTPFVYNDGLCINIDGGMSLGAPGFMQVIHTPNADE